MWWVLVILALLALAGGGAQGLGRFLCAVLLAPTALLFLAALARWLEPRPCDAAVVWLMLLSGFASVGFAAAAFGRQR